MKLEELDYKPCSEMTEDEKAKLWMFFEEWSECID